MAMVTFTADGSSQSTHALRQAIGYIGLVAPGFMILIVRDRDGEGIWQKLESVSAYYWTGANMLFVGMLVTLALFLFFTGDRKNRAETLCAVLAGIAALAVAYYPTAVSEGIPAPDWWKPWMGKVHFAAAAGLFALFAVFSLWFFTRGREGQSKLGNTVHYLCGAAIIVCIFSAGYLGLQGKNIFWPEAIALIAFSISWLVAGYAHSPVINAAKKVAAKTAATSTRS